MKSQFFYKVGFSNNPQGRLIDLQVGNPNPIELVYTRRYKVKRFSKAIESIVHKLLSGQRFRGEWFTGPVENIINAINEAEKHFNSVDSEYEANARKCYPLETIKDIKRKSLYEEILHSDAPIIVIDKFNLKCLLTRGVGLPYSVAKVLGIPAKNNKGWKKRVLGKAITRNSFIKHVDPSLTR
jgi:hypothetical protein